MSKQQIDIPLRILTSRRLTENFRGLPWYTFAAEEFRFVLLPSVVEVLFLADWEARQALAQGCSKEVESMAPKKDAAPAKAAPKAAAKAAPKAEASKAVAAAKPKVRMLVGGCEFAAQICSADEEMLWEHGSLANVVDFKSRVQIVQRW